MVNIKNISDLRTHIANLETQKNHHENYLFTKIENIKNTITRPFTFVKHYTNSLLTNLGVNVNKNAKTDWVNLLARVAIPFALNKLFFGKAGFIAKTLISVFSQGAISNVNKNSVSHWVDALTGFIKSKTRKNKTLDYGIPPDSETY